MDEDDLDLQPIDRDLDNIADEDGWRDEPAVIALTKLVGVEPSVMSFLGGSLDGYLIEWRDDNHLRRARFYLSRFPGLCGALVGHSWYAGGDWYQQTIDTARAIAGWAGYSCLVASHIAGDLWGEAFRSHPNCKVGDSFVNARTENSIELYILPTGLT